MAEPERGRIQFVQYADVLGGIPGREGEGEELFRKANEVILSLSPAPAFLIFNGDHVEGYCSIAELKEQWSYFLQREAIDPPFPVYHLPGNHDTVSFTENIPNPYGRAFPNSEAEDLYRAAFPDIPDNGPPGQRGLSWYAAGSDYVLVALHPIFSGRSSTGFDDLDWLREVLEQFSDKPVKLIASHFPLFPVNGYARHSPYPHASWIIDPEQTERILDLLVNCKVSAYLCAHVCAFDFQIHRNIPQICSAGGGHPVLYPPYAEYHHIARITIDGKQLRAEAIGLDGNIREVCEWPAGGLQISPAALNDPGKAAEIGELWQRAKGLRFRFAGTVASAASDSGNGDREFLCGWDNEIGPPLLWIGIPAGTARLVLKAVLFPDPEQITEGTQANQRVINRDCGINRGSGVNRDKRKTIAYPVTFTGPNLPPEFIIDIILDKTMGPGGVLVSVRESEEAEQEWNSMASCSPFGFESWPWPPLWTAADMGV